MPPIGKEDESATATAAPVRAIKPRRGLPSGRAVVGALLITVASVGAFTLANSDDGIPGTSYLVATRPLEAGAQVSSDDLALKPMMLPYEVAANAVASAADVEGAIATRDLVAGDVISARDLIAAATAGGVPVGAVHELAMPVSKDRIASRIANGDRVTVLITLHHDDEHATVVGAEDVLVLRWSTDGSGSSDGVLTLALGDAMTAMGLAHLVRQGHVTVVRTTRAIDEEYPGRLSTEELLLPSGQRPSGRDRSGPPSMQFGQPPEGQGLDLPPILPGTSRAADAEPGEPRTKRDS